MFRRIVFSVFLVFFFEVFWVIFWLELYFFVDFFVSFVNNSFFLIGLWFFLVTFVLFVRGLREVCDIMIVYIIWEDDLGGWTVVGVRDLEVIGVYIEVGV